MAKTEASPSYTEIDKPRDKCAVVGAISFKGRDVAKDIVVSLAALQHRGQDGTGIAVVRQIGEIELYKKQGLVGNVFFNQAVLTENNLSGFIGIGQNRYATAGSRGLESCLQPHVVEWEGRSLAVAHNGNIPSEILNRLRKDLPVNLPFKSDTDTEVIAWKIMFSKGNSWPEKIENALSNIEGSYALTIATDNGELIGARDKYSIRPLVVGYTEDGIILASETRGLEHHMEKVNHWEEVKGGEMIIAAKGNIDKIQFARSNKTARCIVEPVYFAFPTSRENGFDNSEIRRRMGMQLAKEFPIADRNTIVCGIPESGNHVAEGYAEKSGILYRSGLIHKDRYGAGIRTFIADTDEQRNSLLEYKFSISEGVRGKNLVLIDDSVIRSATSKRLVLALRRAGALKVGLLSGSPPFVDICDLGIDIPDKEKLAAVYKKGEHYKERKMTDIAKRTGLDYIGYLSLDGLVEAIGRGKEELCTHCLTHEHPIFDVKTVVDKTNCFATI